jgi:hypothetical protein
MRHVVIVAYLLLAFVYGAVTPIFEAPDESYHAGMVQYIVRNRGELPIQDPTRQPTPHFQEGSQPPLYYYLIAPIFALIPGSTAITADLNGLPINRHVQLGIGLATHNQNMYLHTSPDEQFPWRGLPLAVHIGRWVSSVLGALTVYAVYRSAKSVFQNDGTATVAAGLVAFNPQFIFIHSSLNNDTLITALSAAVIALTLEAMRGLRLDRQTQIGIAVLVGLAALTKLSGLTLYVFVAGALGIGWLKGWITNRIVFQMVGTCLIAGIGIAGWWYTRNFVLYGDLTGTTMMIAIIEPRKTPYTLYDFLTEMEGLRINGWALFGWLNVIAPIPFYWIMDGLIGVALIGGVRVIVGWWRSRNWSQLIPIGLLGAYFLLLFLSLINWTSRTPGTQGRLLFPGITAIVILIVLPFTGKAKYVLLIPLLILAVYTPFGVILPAYAPPPAIPPPNAAAIRFGQLEVFSIEAPRTPIFPGDSLPITLTYRGVRDSRHLTLFITVYDCAKREIAKLDTHPGGGDLPTSLWTSENAYRDRYLLPISSFSADTCQPYIEVGWYDPVSNARLVRENGELSFTVRSGLLLQPDTAALPSFSTPAGETFGDAIRLEGLDVPTSVKRGDSLTVKMGWITLGALPQDYAILVHLNPKDRIRSPYTGDRQPKNGDYPATVWVKGRSFTDSYTIPIPSDAPFERYTLWIGLYSPTDFQRLPTPIGYDSWKYPIEIEVTE